MRPGQIIGVMGNAGGSPPLVITGTPQAFAVSGATPSWLAITVAPGDVITARTSKVGTAGPWKTRAFASATDSFLLEDDDVAVEVTRSLGASTSSTASIAAAYVAPPENFDVYVDSVAGDDANSGATALLPKKTLGAVIVSAGRRIGLKRGSAWREKLTIAAAGVTVRAYGSGAKPIIDASDVIASGSWTKTGGYTNIYQVTLTVDAHGAASPRPAIWIDGTRCAVVTSLATLDATPGAIYHASVSGLTTITLYLHSTGSTVPSSDGKTYEAAVRSGSIDAFTAQYCNIKGVEGRKPYTSYGSVVVGKYCHAMEWVCRDGNAHNSFNREFSLSEEISAINCYDNTGAPTMFVAYEGINTSGAWVRFFRCNATNAAYVNCIAYYNHNGGGGSLLSFVDYVDCDASNVSSVYSSAHAVAMNVTRGNVSVADAVINTVDVNVTMTGTIIRSMRTGATMGSMQGAGASYVFNQIDAVWNTTGHIRPLGANSTVTLTNSRIEGPNTLFLSSASGITYNVYDNNFVPAGRLYAILSFGVSTPIVNSDRNAYNGSTGTRTIGGVTYTTLAAWQAASGQDLLSTA